MFRIAICDDESQYLDRLGQFLSRFAGEKGMEFEILAFSSADSLLRQYPQKLDLLFLDIAMSGTNGISAARQIRKFDENVCIIFITTMYQYAIEGYSVRAFGFIKKPIKESELRHELTCALRIIEDRRAREHFLTIKCGTELRRLPISHISYCEVRNHQVIVLADGVTHQTRTSITELEKELLSLGFFRCHNSFLVNGDFIQRIDTSEIVLKDGSRVPVSQRRRREFLNDISAYWGGRI